MGQELFGVDIAGIIDDALSDGLPDVLIERYIAGAREPGKLTGGRATTPRTAGCSGFWEDYTGLAPAGVTLELNDRKAVLIGDTIPADMIPMRNDALTIEGQTLYVVKLQSRDPAAAVYVYQCRDRRGPDNI